MEYIYIDLYYIKENNNSDMVVDFDIEFCDLVVIECRGNYCYIGFLYGLRLELYGVFIGGFL